LDISYYTQNITSIFTAAVSLSYIVFSFALIITEKKIKGQGLFAVGKFLQMLFGSILFMWIVGDACTSLKDYFVIENRT